MVVITANCHEEDFFFMNQLSGVQDLLFAVIIDVFLDSISLHCVMNESQASLSSIFQTEANLSFADKASDVTLSFTILTILTGCNTHLNILSY